ncbi:DUF6242 domain-containing protein [uncultured Proteiniphilum sp.]|uniref:DUF6242 domain-containing protein n=1 Tax=uncultured Proteiniphilum sp. TaxID=497637 RepID=UPI002636FC2A|nr:DUF6242 domain-containing protein [uncultured Proteiniphilum sp.]
MISKYFFWTSVLIVNILLFSSCLNSSDNNIEYPSDPQIYTVSLSSKADTAGLLAGVTFTIDQVNGRIFNKEPLPYLFHVDSIILNINSSNTYYPFSRIQLRLGQPDSTYFWNGSDSIPLPRLQKITTTAADGVTDKDYDFQLNIYQEDPYIIYWDKIAGNWLTPPVESQRTIAHNNQFFTYYRSGTEMKAVSTPASDGKNWSAVDRLSGMPHTLRLSSLITFGSAVYALDAPTGWVYRSSDGATWNAVSTVYDVKALYGELPFATPGNILLAVNHDGKLKFAQTDVNFSEIILMNDMPDNMPVTDFSAIKVESASSYATKFIFLSGGITSTNTSNNDIWVLQEDEGIVKYILSKRPEEGALQGSSLFFYDDKPYLITLSAGKNLLMYSENYGLNWVKAGENQAFPSDFTGRTTASVITDTDNNIWIFGGISSSNTQLTDIWKGRLNKFASN